MVWREEERGKRRERRKHFGAPFNFVGLKKKHKKNTQ